MTVAQQVAQLFMNFWDTYVPCSYLYTVRIELFALEFSHTQICT